MQKWYFNGVDLCTKGWYVEAVLDGLGPPGLRGENLQIPFKNGKTNTKKRYKEKNVTLAMWVVGRDKTTGLITQGKTEEELLYENIDYLGSVFGISGVKTLRKVMPNGDFRDALGEVYGQINFAVKPEMYCKFTVEFELSDPFFYGVTKVAEIKTIDIAEKTWEHTYSGIAPCTDMIITLTGPLTNPVITNVENDIWLQYLGVIAQGETVVLNTKDFSCIKGTSNMIGAIKHGGDAYWMILQNGNNSIKLKTDVTGGTVKTEYYPAYF